MIQGDFQNCINDFATTPNGRGCKGICKPNGISAKMYENGEKYCSKCEYHKKTDEVFCRCCGYKLRMTPIN